MNNVMMVIQLMEMVVLQHVRMNIVEMVLLITMVHNNVMMVIKLMVMAVLTVFVIVEMELEMLMKNVMMVTQLMEINAHLLV